MKRLLLTILILQLFSSAESQKFSPNADSLKLALSGTTSDTAKALLLADLGWNYAFLQFDTSIWYAQRAINLSRQLQFPKGEAAGLASYGWALWASANYEKAIEAALKSLNIYKGLKDFEAVASIHNELAVFYRDADDYEQAFKNGFLSKHLYDSLIVSHDLVGVDPAAIIGSIYLLTNQIDSASFYIYKAYEREKGISKYESGYMNDLLGNVEAKKKNYKQALDYYHNAIRIGRKNRNYFDLIYTYSYIARIYQETGNIDSSISYAKIILDDPAFSFFQRGTLDAVTILAQDYRRINRDDSALKYLELSIALNDSLFNKEKTRAVQNLVFNEQLRQQEIEAARIQFQNRIKLYSVFALSGLFLLIGIILYRNNKLKQKANILLQRQKEKVEITLKALESTQSQLIQSEKMASLGELTAGIAHEIQNPLNFINNFSEVNKELIEEMEQEIEKRNTDSLKSIAENVKNNEEKISHHGKRADAIVKGMLQHSRASSGQKEPADINALADEYLRLAYHGLRAKDNSFNSILQTNFDPAIGKINIMSQDMGRVLLNLYNNAFYAVTEKKKLHLNGYEPTVSVNTKRTDDKILISVKDNGAGIPRKIIDKIFQPFFTSKPTGQGTGLGLSMSYDIVKAHGGELKVNSIEGEGAEFEVQIPLM